MNQLIGTKFFVGKTEYIVDRVEPFDTGLKRLIEIAEQTGKYPAMFFASKVLKAERNQNKAVCFTASNKAETL